MSITPDAPQTWKDIRLLSESIPIKLTTDYRVKSGSFEGYHVEPTAPVPLKRTPTQHLTAAILDLLRSSNSLTDSVLQEQARLEAYWEHHKFRTNKEGDFKDVDHFSPMFQYIGKADLFVSFFFSNIAED